MIEINLNALDGWSTQRKAIILACVFCLSTAFSFLCLLASPLRQFQHMHTVCTQESQRIQRQQQTLNREYQHLRQKHEQPPPSAHKALPPLRALHHCAISEFNWQQRLPLAAGQGRPLYSLTTALQYNQAICLLNTLAKQSGEGYLQKMVLSHQDGQPALTMQLEIL